MIEFLLADFNTGFAIAIGFVIALALLEGIGMLIGLSLMGLLDQISPIELDLDVDAEFTDTGLTPLLGWLCLNKLPLLIWLVLFLTSFSIAGYCINYIIINALNSLAPPILVYILASFAALFLTRFLGIPLGRVLPKSESSAVSNNSFKGLIAKITIGTAQINSPAEAILLDKYNQKHYVMVSPDDEKEIFTQGEEVVLVEKKDNIWLAVKFTQ